MSSDVESAPLIDRVLTSGNRRLQKAAAEGLLPLPPQELVPLQVALTRSADEELAELAGRALAATDPRIVAGVVADSSSEEVLSHFALHGRHPMVLEKVLLHSRISSRLLVEMAPGLQPELQEILLLRQDLIVGDAEILDALEKNPELSSYSRRRVREYREHLVPPSEAAPAERRPEVIEATDEEVEEAVELARDEPAEGEVDELTGLSEGQIRTLPVPVRLKLARGAPRTLRAILVRDKNALVACAVLDGNAMSDSEIEQIASNRAVIDDVLVGIARSRSWTRKYGIVLALIRNPRTPAGLALRLMPRLSVRDLRMLAHDRGITDVVRTQAKRLYRIKAV